MKQNITYHFLIASLFSSLGDALLYLALPIGLGLNTGNISDSVILFLIPAFFMLASSFISDDRFKPKTLNRDFGKLLLTLGLFEVLIALLCVTAEDLNSKKIFLYIFVAVYAFIKEGVPRLYYNYEVFKLFFPDKDYAKGVGLTKSVGIIGSFLGIFVSLLTVKFNLWDYALVFDALTFIYLGLVILKSKKSLGIKADMDLPVQPKTDKPLKEHAYINFIVPYFVFLSSLYWPFLPLINKAFGVATITESIITLALVKLPGIMAGAKFDKISKYYGTQSLLYFIPWFAILATASYLVVPNSISYVAIIFGYSLMEGLYWPADYSYRDKLSDKIKLKFNRANLRYFSIFQGFGCVIGYFIYSQPNFLVLIQLTYAVAIMLALLYFTVKNLKLIKVLAVSLVLTACAGKNVIHVEVPNLSQEIKLNNALTYSETIITNITSGHLLRMDKDLNLVKEILGSVTKISNSHYIININKEFSTFRKEKINADDLVFTFKYYIQNMLETMRVLGSIKGANTCRPKNCKELKVRKIEEHRVEVKLTEDNPNFINDLISPVFLILKSNRPVFEIIGKCIIPYQTGRGFISHCDDNNVEISYADKKIKISTKPSKNSFKITARSNSVLPSLTTMFFLKNPSAPPEMNEFLKGINNRSKFLTESLGIPHAKTFTSKWLGLETKDFNVPPAQEGRYPKEVKLVIAQSIPNHKELLYSLRKLFPKIKINAKVVASNVFFEEAKRADVSLLWLTPGYFDFYDLISIFDCDPNRLCWFNYSNNSLQELIRELRQPENRYTDQKTTLKVEELLQREGYLAPLSLVGWSLKLNEKELPTHPAGLFMLDLTELNYD